MREFDELKEVNNRAIPYEQYFGDMELTEEQKQERIELSEKIEEVMLFMFALVSMMSRKEYKIIDISYIVAQSKKKCKEIVGQNVDIDEYLGRYIDEFIENAVETTVKNKEDEYYSSENRAKFNAENEANTVLNYKDYQDAVVAGKKNKRWRTENDAWVRKTHRKLHMQVLPIETAFAVGDSLMLFPKDTSFGASAKEIVNCRCTVEYF